MPEYQLQRNQSSGARTVNGQEEDRKGWTIRKKEKNKECGESVG